MSALKKIIDPQFQRTLWHRYPAFGAFHAQMADGFTLNGDLALLADEKHPHINEKGERIRDGYQVYHGPGCLNQAATIGPDTEFILWCRRVRLSMLSLDINEAPNSGITMDFKFWLYRVDNTSPQNPAKPVDPVLDMGGIGYLPGFNSSHPAGWPGMVTNITLKGNGLLAGHTEDFGPNSCLVLGGITPAIPGSLWQIGTMMRFFYSATHQLQYTFNVDCAWKTY